MEPRKASEIILELENKIDILTALAKSQDLNIKVLSNKLNSIISVLEKQSAMPPKIVVEAVNSNHLQPPEKKIEILGESNIKVDDNPSGFRRTSRPESYAGDNDYLKKPSSMAVEEVRKFPVQIPKGNSAEIIVPKNRTAGETLPTKSNKKIDTDTDFNSNINQNQNFIPTRQRVVDHNGKSIYLADVEIIDMSTMQSFYKTRTNGTGKWLASLPVGNFRVLISKREAIGSGKLESSQEFMVDGSISPLDLDMVIIKK